MRRQKFEETVNQRLIELEEVALDKLNKIYQNRFIYTESYFELKKILNENKKINLNLIMLNMALIVDSDN